MRHRSFEKEKNQEEKNKDLHISFSLCCRKKNRTHPEQTNTIGSPPNHIYFCLFDVSKKGCEDKQNTERIKSLNMKLSRFSSSSFTGRVPTERGL